MQAAFNNLSLQLRELDGTLAHLEWAILYGQTDQQDNSPVNGLYDKVVTLRGYAATAGAAIANTSGRGSLVPARLALVDCQRHYGLVLAAYYNDLATPDLYETLRSLMTEITTQNATETDDETVTKVAFGARDWSQWAWGVRDALDSCAEPIHELNNALWQCWQELADRVEPPEVIVNPAAYSALLDQASGTDSN
jgi:hypothetical protein